MLKNKHFADLAKVCSILPALVVMPAMAVSITDNTSLNDKFPDGVINETVSSLKGFSGVITTPTIAINATGNALQVQGEKSRMELGADAEKITSDIKIKSDTKAGIVANKKGTVLIGGDKTESVDIVAATKAVSASSANIDITGRNININGAARAIDAQYASKVNVNGDNIKLHSDTSQALIVFDAGTEINVRGGRVDISTDTEGPYAAVHAGEGGAIDITADDIVITGNMAGVAAMSGGSLNINGNTHIQAEDKAIMTRGGAIININKNADSVVKIDGNINFDYNRPTSGTAIDADVNVTLVGADSYWNGNTVAAYTEIADSEEYMTVAGMNLDLRDGATWNAAKITDVKNENEGVYYIALNNLNIDGGVVNVLDDARGIAIDNANISNATFNGGPVTINNKMEIAGGTNVFNSDIFGTDGALVVNNGATLNIGDSMIDIDSITLDGTIVANLTDRADAIFTTNAFNGAGKLSFVMKQAGEYKIFGNAVFDGDAELGSALYHLVWNDDKTSVSAEMKSVADIADDNGLSAGASNTIVNLVNSDSDTLNDFGMRVQERLAAGDAAAVEKAAKSLNSDKASVIQSVATNLSSTVANLASSRMELAMLGRNGGDAGVAGGVWTQGLYNKSKLNNLFNGYTRGVAAGLDGTINRVFTVGAGYAFNHSDMDVMDSDVEIDSNTVFVYGQYKPSKWYVNSVLNYTISDFTESADVLGVPVSADYKLTSWGVHVASGYNFASGITPEVGLRYLHIDDDSYTNSLGIRTKIDDAEYFTATAGAKYAFDIKAGKYLTLRPEMRAAIKYDLTSDKFDSVVAMPGVDSYGVIGDRLNRMGGELSTGFGMIYKSMSLSLNYNIEVRKDYKSQTGMVRARYNF